MQLNGSSVQRRRKQVCDVSSSAVPVVWFFMLAPSAAVTESAGLSPDLLSSDEVLAIASVPATVVGDLQRLFQA
jgi:hypothetical protein